MANILATGQTETGKTLLTKSLVTQVSRVRPVIVFDPTLPRAGRRIGGWSADHVTPDFAEFSRIFWGNTGCFAVIDEAPIVSVGEHRADFRRMLMAGRHQGHVVNIIGQRPTALDCNARNQCSEFRIFRIGKSDSELLANEIAAPAVANAYLLKNGQYYEVTRGGRCTLKRIF